MINNRPFANRKECFSELIKHTTNGWISDNDCYYNITVIDDDGVIVSDYEEDFRKSIAQSLEELGKDLVFSSLRELYYTLKKSKFRYRLSLDDVSHPMFSSYFSQRSLILKYCV